MMTGQTIVIDGGVVGDRMTRARSKQIGSPLIGAPATARLGDVGESAPSWPRPVPIRAWANWTATGFEPALLAVIERLDRRPDDRDRLRHGRIAPRLGRGALCCGALRDTARADWCKPRPTDPDLTVYVIPGIKQANPADVMRGEETQIAGFLARNKNWDGVICLPGTHTKWVHVSADEVVSFHTFMTGELFDC